VYFLSKNKQTNKHITVIKVAVSFAWVKSLFSCSWGTQNKVYFLWNDDSWLFTCTSM